MSSSSMQGTSFSSLLTISLPLMLTGATEGLMLFSDRALLAHYSVDAMNAASATFMMTAVFIFFAVAIAGIAEVLAGQYNGEKRFKNVGRAVWQILYFCAGLTFFFIPLGIWGKTFLLPDELKEISSSYFTIICFSAPLWSMQVALAGFFACTGRARWLTPIAILANVINITLDYFLIFGVGPIPSLGTTGAALATSMAQGLHVLFLLSLFLRKKERLRYGTGQLTWFPKDIIQACKVGLPNAISHGVELSAWALMYKLTSRASTAHLTVLSTVTGIHMLIGFLNEGLKQGVLAIASNLIGGSQFDKIKNLLRSGILLQACVGFLAFFPMILGTDFILSLLGEVAKETSLIPHIKVAMAFMWLFIVFDGLVWIINGILTAGGDTRVTMLINIACAWFMAVAPSWYFLSLESSPPWLAVAFSSLYAFSSLLLHSLRFSMGKWKNKLTANSEAKTL